MRDIEDWNDLNAVRDNLDSDHKILNDLDEDTAGYDEYIANPDDGWVPIGDFSNPFSGTFDGQGNEIIGLVSDSSLRPDENYVGLFSVTSGSITNITLRTPHLEHIDSSDEPSGTLGAVAGINFGEISETSVIDGNITSNNRTGGLVGDNAGKIVDSMAQATVDGDKAGGLVAGNTGDIIESSAEITVTGGKRVGGLTGSNSDFGEVTKSSANGEITGSNTVGGLVGANEDDCRVFDSSADGTISGQDNVGGLAGENTGEIDNSSAACDVSGNSRTGGFVGINSGNIIDSSAKSETVGEDVRIGGFVGKNKGKITGSSAEGKIIAESADAVGGLVGDSEGTIAESSAACDVDGHERIGGLAGQHGGEISNSSSGGEIAGEVSVGGLVGVTNGSISNSTSNATVTGTEEVGGLVGYTSADLITESSATGDVTGDQIVGGLVGHAYGLPTISGSFASTSVAGSAEVGGLIGRLDSGNFNSTAYAVYATGSVSGDQEVGGLIGRHVAGTVTRSYATGQIIGNGNAGGLIGRMAPSEIFEERAVIEDSYWDTQATNQADVVNKIENGDPQPEVRGDVKGLETVQMQGQAAKENMTALDFEGIWETVDGGYPVLPWEVSEVVFRASATDIQPDETSDLQITTQDVDRLIIEKLWTDWLITEKELDGGEVTNIDPPATPAEGVVEISWDDKQDVSITLGVEPNHDANLDSKYIGGEYLLRVRRNNGDNEKTTILGILNK
jgi:hypothetical protein